MQGTRVPRSLVWKDSACRGATTPMHHNYWACLPQNPCSTAREATVMRSLHPELENSPRSPQLEKALAQQWRPSSVQFSSVAQSCPTLWDPMACSTPGLPVHHQLPEFTQTRIHWVSDAIQPSHPLSPPSPPAFNLSQHQGLFKWVSSLHQVAKVLEFQLQHQSFQWTLRADLL